MRKYKITLVTGASDECCLKDNIEFRIELENMFNYHKWCITALNSLGIIEIGEIKEVISGELYQPKGKAFETI